MRVCVCGGVRGGGLDGYVFCCVNLYYDLFLIQYTCLLLLLLLVVVLVVVVVAAAAAVVVVVVVVAAAVVVFFILISEHSVSLGVLRYFTCVRL